MQEKKVEANYVKCDLCGLMVPQSCVIFEKGGTFPELVNTVHRKRGEHKTHGIQICSKCYTHLRVTKAMAA